MKTLATFVLVLTGCLIPMQPAAQQPPGGYQGQPTSGGGGGDPNGPGPASPSSPMAGGSPSTQSAPSAPQPSSVVSVTVRSECGQTVKVFYGEKPKYGSGTNSSISSHSQENHSFRPGDMMWIIDDSENGVASVTVRSGMHEIDISGGCTTLSAR